MADPTAEDVLAYAGGANGRVSLVRREVLRLMRVSLPGAIALHNTRESGAGLQAPRAYLSARLPADDEKFPLLMVGASSGRAQSPGRMNFRTLTVMIYLVTRATEIEAQLDALWDTAELCEAIMTTVQGFHCLPAPDGRKVWTQALWQSTSQLPAEWPQYSGAAIEYTIDQWGLDLWTPPSA